MFSCHFKRFTCNPVSCVSVGFTNGDSVKYVTTDSSGIAKYSTDNFEVGSYDVRVAFWGNDYYNGSGKVIAQVVINKS